MIWVWQSAAYFAPVLISHEEFLEDETGEGSQHLDIMPVRFQAKCLKPLALVEWHFQVTAGIIPMIFLRELD